MAKNAKEVEDFRWLVAKDLYPLCMSALNDAVIESNRRGVELDVDIPEKGAERAVELADVLIHALWK